MVKQRFLKLLSIFGSLFFLLFSLLPVIAIAYEWEVPFPQAPGGATLDENSIDSIFTYIYNFGLGLGGLFAFFRLVQAGILWGGEAGNVGSKAQAMGIIQGTIFGLLLLLFSWVILNTINPQILNLNIGGNPVSEGETGSSKVLESISKQYLLQSKPDEFWVFGKPDYDTKPGLVCPLPFSSVQKVCSNDCTDANDPCDYYMKLCADGTLEDPVDDGRDPRCPDPKEKLKCDPCKQVFPWRYNYPNRGCNYDVSFLEKIGGNQAYAPYLKESADYFGVPPGVLFAAMLSESEELLPILLTDSEILAAAAPGGYVGWVGKTATNEGQNWCEPNEFGCGGPTAICWKACGMTGLGSGVINENSIETPQETDEYTDDELCIWGNYCKFRGGANNIRGSDSYKPNPSNIRDAFAITAKKLRSSIDIYVSGFYGSCPGPTALFPELGGFPEAFYVWGHTYYGNCLFLPVGEGDVNVSRFTSDVVTYNYDDSGNYQGYTLESDGVIDAFRGLSISGVDIFNFIQRRKLDIVKTRKYVTGGAPPSYEGPHLNFDSHGRIFTDGTNPPTYCDWMWYWTEKFFYYEGSTGGGFAPPPPAVPM